jgi:uncharacterized membrane protein
MTAEQIIFLILIFVVLAIIFTLNIFAKAYVYGGWLNRMKNSSGNYNAGKILMMVAAAVALYFLLYFLFIRKPTTRQSLTRTKEETN